MPELAQRIAPVVSPTALITDVGSVKGCVVEALGPIFRGRARFIGSHPMAGSEQTGLAAARADLFRDSVCIVTPDPSSAAADVAEVRAFWETLGCRVRELGPQEHDEIVARVSHFPHLLAAALVQSVQDAGSHALQFAGPGFRDTTRVAAGPPEMWTEILRTNRRAVQKSAEAMIEKLREVITLLDRDAPGDDLRMNEFLSQAKALRDTLRPRANEKK
jgi:prephenate dehydrogenase